MIAVTIVLILSILLSRVTVNVLVYCVYCDEVHVRCSASGFCIISKFCVKSVFYVSEVTTRKGNESIVQEENCFVEEIKEVELRSRREKFIYNRTYNPVGLNKVSHFSRRGGVPSRLTDEEIKIFVLENTDSATFCMEGSSENYTIVV